MTIHCTKTLGEYVRTKLSQRFRFFLGESLRNRGRASPTTAMCSARVPNINAVRAVFRAVLRVVQRSQTSPGSTCRSTRRRDVAFDFIAKLTDGSTLIVRPTDDDFVLDLLMSDTYRRHS